MKRKFKVILSIAFAILSVTSLCLSLLLPSIKAERERIMQTIVSTATTGTGASTADASKKGGGIFLEPESQFTMAGGTISGHTRDYGGAVYVSRGAIFTMTGGTISSNLATYGGAIYVESGGEFHMSGGTIENNKASFGGAIYIESGAKCYVDNGSILGNTSFSDLVYFHIEEGGLLQLNGGTLYSDGQSGIQTMTAPTCSMSGSVIDISPVSGALGYRIDLEKNTGGVKTGFITTQTQIDLSNHIATPGEYNVYVVAIGEFATCSATSIVDYEIAGEPITITIWIEVFQGGGNGGDEGVCSLGYTVNGVHSFITSSYDYEYPSEIVEFEINSGQSWADIVVKYNLSVDTNEGEIDILYLGDYWDQSSNNPVFTEDTNIVLYHCLCFDRETLVECYDEKRKRRYKKKLKDITYKDKLVVWNFDKGCFDMASPLFILKEHIAQRYTEVTFSDGNIVRYVGQDDSKRHRILNIETGKFEYVGHEGTPVGTSTLNDKGEIVKVVSIKFVDKSIKYMNIITKYHINCFAGGIIASDRMSNIYPIKDLKYVKDNRPLATYEDYPEIEKEYFDGLRLAEQPINIRRAENDVTSYNNYTEFVTKLKEMSKPRD